MGLPLRRTGILPSMSDRGKTAIILSGGGMRSTHGGGFLYALATELGITQPDIMIGSSGDAGNVLYFSAGQYEGMRRIWRDFVATPKFVSLLRFWRIMDVDYLVDTIFKKQEPLDVEKVFASPIRWLIPISDFETGESRYVDASDKLDPFEVMRASKAIPIYFGKIIPLAGRRYIDGELGPRLDDHVGKALKEGATRLVVINHTTPWTNRNSFIIRLYAMLMSHGLHDAIIRDISTSAFHVEHPRAKIIFIAPKGLPVGTASHNREKLRATFDRGVEDARALKGELRTLFHS